MLNPTPLKRERSVQPARNSTLALVEAWSLVEGGEEGLLSSMEAPHSHHRQLLHSHTLTGQPAREHVPVVLADYN